MADPLVPVQVTFALFALKAVEFSALLSGGLAKAKTHRERYDLITAAYQGQLKFLRLLVWLRPGIMIITALLLAVVTAWFDLTIYNYYSPGSFISPIIAKTDPYAVNISIAALLVGVLVYVFTSFSWAKFYTSFRFVLSKSQYQQRLASRIDRETDGYFYIDEEQSEKIARHLVEAVLKDPSWYKESLVYRPKTIKELKSAEYANFLFFGELVEAKAAAGKAMERWCWIKKVYVAQPNLFSVAKLEELKQGGNFASTLVHEMKTSSPSAPPEAFGMGLTKVLNSGIARLGKRFEYDMRNIARMNAWNNFLITAKRRTVYDVVNKRLAKFEPYKKRSGNRVVLIKLMVARKLWDIPVAVLEFPFSAWQCVFLLRSNVINTDLEKFSAYDPDFAWFRDAALRKLTNLVKASLDALSDPDKKKMKEILNPKLDPPSAEMKEILNCELDPSSAEVNEILNPKLDPPSAEMKEILNSELDPSNATMLTDTFLWALGNKCCQFNKCGKVGNEKEKILDLFLDSLNLNYTEVRGEKGKICPFTSLAICDPDKGKKLFYYQAPNFELK